MNNLKKSALFLFVYYLSATASHAAALGDQWYIGLGGGSSWLQPNPRQVGIDIERRLGVGGSLFVGADIDDRSSGQLTLYGLGDAELDNNELVAFHAFDGSVLYRLFDTKDTRIRRSGMHLALYGRFALGFLYRDTDERLVNDSAVYFGAGGGAEWFINRAFSVRLEGMYLDKDASYASVQLVGRFGGRRFASSNPRPKPASTDVQSSSVELPDTPKFPAESEPTVPPVSTASPKQSEPVVESLPTDELAEDSAPAVSLDADDPTEAVEQIEPDEQVDLAEKIEPIESEEPIEPVESVELIEPVETVERVESVQPVEAAELAEQAELAELIEPIEPTVPSISDDATESAIADGDGDNVPDAEDQCLASRPGYPVRSTGCALFDGVLSGVNFVAGSSALLPDATDQLDFLANVLIQYPKAKVELHAHTDNNGTVKDQTALTRARVRTIGAYLVRQGVSVDRLVLRSFGGSRPLYGSGSKEGPAGNNRVEVIEARN